MKAIVVSMAITAGLMAQVAIAEDMPANTSASNPASECIAQIKSKKELQILNGKIVLEGSADQPLEILANNNVPTKKEKEAISLWVNEHKRCQQLGDEYLRNNNYPPAIIAIVDKGYSDILFVAADLYAKKISYGDFAKAQVKIYRELKENMVAAKQQIRQQQQAENKQRETLKQQQAQQERDALAQQQQEDVAQQKNAEPTFQDSLGQGLRSAAMMMSPDYAAQQSRQSEIMLQQKLEMQRQQQEELARQKKDVWRQQHGLPPAPIGPKISCRSYSIGTSVYTDCE